jgi:hypothetical protein
MHIRKTLLSILCFFKSFFLSFVLVLPFIGSFLVLPGPLPQVYPNSNASDIVSHRETQWCHPNATLRVVVARKLGQQQELFPTFLLVPTHTYTTKTSKFGLFLWSSYLSQGRAIQKSVVFPRPLGKLIQNHLSNTDSLIGCNSFGTSGSLNILLI